MNCDTWELRTSRRPTPTKDLYQPARFRHITADSVTLTLLLKLRVSGGLEGSVLNSHAVILVAKPKVDLLLLLS